MRSRRQRHPFIQQASQRMQLFQLSFQVANREGDLPLLTLGLPYLVRVDPAIFANSSRPFNILTTVRIAVSFKNLSCFGRRHVGIGEDG